MINISSTGTKHDLFLRLFKVAFPTAKVKCDQTRQEICTHPNQSRRGNYRYIPRDELRKGAANYYDLILC
jgi:hypothetical protein